MGKVDQDKLRMVVNKRTSPSDWKVERLNNIEVTSGGIFAYLLESIFDEDPANFLGLYIDSEGVSPYSGSYTVHYDSSIIEFSAQPTVVIYAKYRGGGSIIWADDVNDLNRAVAIIDNNTVYSDGSTAMTGNLNFNNNSITNINKINNVDINEHKHLGSGVDGTEQLGDDSISSISISKVNGLQTALDSKQNNLPEYVTGKYLTNNGSVMSWGNVQYGNLSGNIYNQQDLWNLFLKGLSYDSAVSRSINGYPKDTILRFYDGNVSYLIKSLKNNNQTTPSKANIKYRDGDNNKSWECIENVIVKTYKSGSSWYRLWSDGWCEQGGRLYCASSVKSKTQIDFIKPFEDTNYYISFTAEQETGSNPNNTDDITLTTYQISTNNVKVYAYDSGQNNYAFYCRWRAEGYVANQTITTLLNISNIENGFNIVEQVGTDITVNANDTLDITLAGAGAENDGGGILRSIYTFTSNTILRLKKVKGRYNSTQLGLVLFKFDGENETPILAAGGRGILFDSNSYGGSGYNGGKAQSAGWGDPYSGYSYNGNEGNSEISNVGASGSNKQSGGSWIFYGGSGYIHPDFISDTVTVAGSSSQGNYGLAYAKILKVE